MRSGRSNYKAWFARNFSAEDAQKLSSRYEAMLPGLAERLQKDLRYTSPGIVTEFGVDLWSKEKADSAQGADKIVLASLKEPEWYFKVSIVPPGRKTRWAFATFFYVDGAYRYFPYSFFLALSNSATSIRTSWNVQQAKVIRQDPPDYPAEARDRRIQGTVYLQIVIAPLGWVMECKPVSGDPVLIPAAVAAVRKWLYQPTLLNGEPVEVQTRVEVNFVLTR